MKKLSIIIVNYNVTDLLRACLKSIENFVQGIDYEVIVVDNASSDTTWKELIPAFPQVQFVPQKNNFGFAVANNLAVKIAQGEYILLLNPDTEFESHDLKEALDFADSMQDFGCLGVQMHNKLGHFLPESKRSVPGVFNSFNKLFVCFGNSNRKTYYRNDILASEIAEVEVITGAFFLCRKQTYQEVGGLDEAYFMYGEDIDLCYSLLRAKKRNWYYGKVSILHHKGESTVKDKIYLERFFGAMQIFVDKYYRGKKPIQYFILSMGLRFKHFLERRKLRKSLQ